jgi:hypothetical protein
MNARIGDKHGRDAAYEILSWSNVSLTIEHDCVYKEKLLQGDLQAILLDAMRVKDEMAEEMEAEEESAGSEILLDSVHDEPEPKPVPKAPPPKPKKTTAKVRPVRKEPDLSNLTPIELIRTKIKNAIGSRNGVIDVYHDQSWDGLVDQASTIGDAFNCGQLNVLYVNKDSNDQFIIVPGDDTTAISISPDSPWDRIIDVLG